MSSITFSHSLSLSDLAGKVAKTTKAKIKVSKVKKSIDLPAYDSLIPPLVTRKLSCGEIGDIWGNRL